MIRRLNGVVVSRDRMLERLAHLIVRRRRVVIGIWIALTIFGAYSAGAVSKRWYQSFSIPGYSAYETDQATLKLFGSGEEPPLVASSTVWRRDGEGRHRRSGRGGRRRRPGRAGLLVLVDGQPRLRLGRWSHDLRRALSAGQGDLQLWCSHRPVRNAIAAHTPPGVQSHLTGLLPLEAAATGGKARACSGRPDRRPARS